MSITLPSISRYVKRLERIFASGRVTNNGECVRELERRLRDVLGVPYLVLTSSGTLALQVAFRIFGLSGEIVTTPFSWVTTASSMVWSGLRPRFVDIDASSFNLDPVLAAKAITSTTAAIVPVHVFGNPCDVEAFEGLARQRSLPLIYDAAHAFGVRYGGDSVLQWGDASILSLHATKLFHTIEGGALILHREEDYRRAWIAVNNGFDQYGTLVGIGVNGRMSELHAAVGLCLLETLGDQLANQRKTAQTLRKLVGRRSGIQLQKLNSLAEANHAFFPVVLPDEASRAEVERELEQSGFAVRRYFWPPLNRIPGLDDGSFTPLADSLSRRVLCIRLHAEYRPDVLSQIADIVTKRLPDVEMTVAAALAPAGSHPAILASLDRVPAERLQSD